MRKLTAKLSPTAPIGLVRQSVARAGDHHPAATWAIQVKKQIKRDVLNSIPPKISIPKER
ncbi:MAG TPA: hypothetical protein P5563_08285 [Saprospiraceae bacterium]|nr:hypothetical protein [Saprospiraceae bacterium]